MNVAALKVELIKQLVNTNNASLIKHITALFETEQTDLWDEMPDEIKASARKAMEQGDKGEYKSHREVMSKYKKWQKK